MSTANMPWPTEINVTDTKDELAITFDTGDKFNLSAEMLRVMSPSAEVQGHSPEERKTVGMKKNVKIASMEAVGNYAVKIIFDDGHSTGLFSWEYLHELGTDKDTRWAAYLGELADKGLKRE